VGGYLVECGCFYAGLLLLVVVCGCCSGLWVRVVCWVGLRCCFVWCLLFGVDVFDRTWWFV